MTFSTKGLTKASFKQSQIDPCLYYRPGLIFLVYINDCFLLSAKDKFINQGIQDLHAVEPQFNMKDQGTVNDFLGIQVKYNKNGEIMLTQPQLIASILSDLHLQKDNIITCKTLAYQLYTCTKILRENQCTQNSITAQSSEN